MGQDEKLFLRIMSGRSDADISFERLCHLLGKFGFEERIKGSHHIFWRTGMEEILNLQPKGAQAKPYQVRQVRDLFLKYRLGAELDVQV